MPLPDLWNILCNNREISTYKNILVRRKRIFVLDSTGSGREPEVGTFQPTNKPLSPIRVADFFYVHRFIYFLLSVVFAWRHRVYPHCLTELQMWQDVRREAKPQLKADSHIACSAHAVPLPCRALIHTCHAAPLPCSNSESPRGSRKYPNC